MQRHSKGVFALSFATFCAACAAGCTNGHLDLFDPSWPGGPPAHDAAPNPGLDASSVDAARPPSEGDAGADVGQGPGSQTDGAAPESAPPPAHDAMDPKDAGVTVPEDAGGMEIVDAQVVDVRIDIEGPSIDAGRPFDAGTDLDCIGMRGIVFRGHCYFSIPATQWEEDACEAQKAHLATLTSADEQIAVATLAAGQERWIGLRRRNNSPATPRFDWVTGEPFSYSNWHEYNDNSREPNNTGDCVRLLTGGTWADSDCSDRFPTLCERE